MKAAHFLPELFGRQVDVFNLDFEVLSCAEREIFLHDVFKAYEDAKIVDFLSRVERVDNAVDFVVGKIGALILRAFDFLFSAEIGSVDEQSFIGAVRVKEDDRNICAGVGEDIRRHGDDAAQNFFVNDVLTNF